MEDRELKINKKMKKVLSYCAMKLWMLALCFVCMQMAAYAQQPGDGGQPGNGKLRTVIIGYITRQLELTETEAQKFWPIYNEYEKEMMAARKANKEDELAKEEALLKVRKTYKTKFTTAGIPEAKVNKLYKIEKEMITKIREAIQKRNENNGGGGRGLRDGRPRMRN
jgi:Spy/CpxP family protein refolding chaperone